MNTLNVSGTVSFKEECKDRWQTIYSSSVYGTTFTILGKFTYDNRTRILASCELRLKNYKGPINLGIETVGYEFERKWVEIFEKDDEDNLERKIIRVISIKTNIRALIPNGDKKVEGAYRLTECDLKNDVYLEIDRELLELSKTRRSEEGYVFDSEFYYRDGDRNPEALDTEFRLARDLNPTIEAKCVTEVINGNEVTRIEEVMNNDSGNSNQGVKSPGAVCPKGYSKIIF